MVVMGTSAAKGYLIRQIVCSTDVVERISQASSPLSVRFNLHTTHDAGPWPRESVLTIVIAEYLNI